MISSPAGGLVLAALSILASGYIIHSAPICRFWLPLSTGYVLYFRIISTGLVLVFFLVALLYTAATYGVPFPTPEYAAILAFPIALVGRGLAGAWVWFYGKKKPEWKYSLNLKRLNEKGLDQFIYERISTNKMIMVTLENKKVYAGWPIEAPNKEENQWLRLVPHWSGYRDEEAMIKVQINYSKVFGMSPSEQNHMLIPVEKIVTVQPFDAAVFDEFNPTTSK